ncbi:hypothetical protein SUGI_0074730 [Cryptomeria japonica]|nr:hypothetical protein SUGI_0074730 [Cryptomeria japonica]
MGENGSASDNNCPTEEILDVFETQPRDNSEDMTERKNKKRKRKDLRTENSVNKKMTEENSGVGFREVYEMLDSCSQESKKGRKKANKYLAAENGLDKELKEAGITTKKRKHKDLEAVDSLEKELEEENNCAAFKRTAETQDSRSFENAEGGKKKKKRDVKFEDSNENGYEEIPRRKEKKKKNDAGIQTEELSKKNSQTRESKGLLYDEIDERPLRYHGGEKDQFNGNSGEENPSEYISVKNDFLRKNSIKNEGSKSNGGKKAGAIDESVGSQSIRGNEITEKEKKKKKNKGLSQEKSEEEVRNSMGEIEESTDKTMGVDKSMSIDGLASKEKFKKKKKKKKNRVNGEENLDELEIFEKSSIGRTEVERSAKRKKNRAEGGRVEVKRRENTSNKDNLLHENVHKEKRIYNVAAEEAENPERLADGRSKKKRKNKQTERVIVSGDDDNHWGTGDANNSRKDADKSSTDDRSLYKKQKKVTFSSQVQVCDTEEMMDKEDSEDPGFPGEISDKQDQIVWGKRYSPEEDQAIRDAISKYIKEHGLAEAEGLQMILNCKKHTEVRNCWKEIAAALPWRPFKSVYVRGHILYERSNERCWTQDEIEGLRRLHDEHGKKWNKIAQVLGKCRYHVKDKWRAIRRGVMKQGALSQDEYQRLSDLVHYNLQLKLSEKEQECTHRRHRDNINWEAIADKMGTRDHVFCCKKWYGSFVSSLIEAGLWESGDDKVLLRRLLETNASNEEAVDWDDLVKGRSGEICKKRWKQMVRQLGEPRNKQLFEKIDLLVRRYAPELME